MKKKHTESKKGRRGRKWFPDYDPRKALIARAGGFIAGMLGR